MKYRLMKVVNSKTNECFGVFWIDEDGQIDVDNLPNDLDVARILKALMHSDLSVEQTDEVDYDE